MLSKLILIAFSPKLSVSGDLAEQIKSEMTLVMNTHGMTVNDPARDTITTVPFMSTSDQAFAVTEQDQKQGEYILEHMRQKQ